MGEMKKKIQLVEGERKAIFEDCEREKDDNRDNIRYRVFNVHHYLDRLSVFQTNHGHHHGSLYWMVTRENKYIFSLMVTRCI